MGKTPLYIALEKRLVKGTSLEFFSSQFDKSYDLISLFNPTLELIFKFCKPFGIQGPKGETVLHAAARPEVTSEWIQKICQCIQPDIIKQQDNQGFTPLHYAAYFNNHIGASYLLDAEKSMAYITAEEDKHECMMPLHIAAIRGHTKVIEEILRKCQDCWDGLTSKDQNILHLAAKGQHIESMKYILEQPWAINLMNMKDIDGNTPSHLLLSSIPKDYKTIKPLLEHPNLYVDAYNSQNVTSLEMIEKAEILNTTKKVYISNKVENNFWNFKKNQWVIDDIVDQSSEKEVNKKERLTEIRKNAKTQLLASALIATVTYAAGFTLPGGYDNDDGTNQGMAILSRKVAFKAFIVSDTIALISSCVAIFLHSIATLSLYKHNEAAIFKGYTTAMLFLLLAMLSMEVAFVMGLYVALENSTTIAIILLFLGGFGILYLLYLVRTVYRDLGFVADGYLWEIIVLVVSFILFHIFEIGRYIFKCVTYILRPAWKCIMCHSAG